MKDIMRVAYHTCGIFPITKTDIGLIFRGFLIYEIKILAWQVLKTMALIRGLLMYMSNA